MAKDSLTATRRTADVAEAPANPLDATAAVAAWHEFAMLGAKTMSEGLAQGLSTWSAVAAEAGKAAAPPPPRPPVNPFLAWMEVWQSAVMPLPAPVNPWSAWLSLWPTPASKTAGSFPMPGFPGVFNPLTAANPFLSAFNSMPAKWPMQAGWSMGPTGPVWSPLAAAWR